MSTTLSNESILIFENDNPSNTVITQSGTGSVVYAVSTHTEDRRTFTRFQNTHGELLASSEWQLGLNRDLISMGQLSSVPFGSYFKKNLFKGSLTFIGPNKKKFSWKEANDGLKMELYQDGAKDKGPVATFTKRRRVTDTSTTCPTSVISPAKLVLDDRGVEMRDLVVITFCLVEKARRKKEDSTFRGTGNMGETTRTAAFVTFSA